METVEKVGGYGDIQEDAHFNQQTQDEDKEGKEEMVREEDGGLSKF